MKSNSGTGGQAATVAFEMDGLSGVQLRDLGSALKELNNRTEQEAKGRPSSPSPRCGDALTKCVLDGGLFRSFIIEFSWNLLRKILIEK